MVQGHDLMQSQDKTIQSSYFNPIMVSVKLNKYEVRQVLVDTGSSINLITFDIFYKLGKKDLIKISYPFDGLVSKIVVVLGSTNLLGYENVNKSVIFG